MPEEQKQLDRIEDMMVQMLRMVKATNALLANPHDDMVELQEGQAKLGTRQDTMEAEIELLHEHRTK